MNILDDNINYKIIEAIFDFTPFNQLHNKAGITAKSLKKRLFKLEKEGVISKPADSTLYQIKGKVLHEKTYQLNQITEHEVFEKDIVPLNLELNNNSDYTMFYSFTEMLNNAIDHSKGKTVQVAIQDSFCGYEIFIIDDGIGIFKKIKKVFRLRNEEESILQLSKGKLTTDQDNHSGQGIFFTSRMVDHFAVFSGDNYFTHDYDRRKDVLSLGNPSQVGKKKGTAVIMSIRKNSSIEAKKLFDDFSSEDGEFSFQKTIVPIKLVKYATKDMLVSRSQAKMVLSGLEDFTEIIFDFKGVMMIGQGFADELFRVYKKNNPNKKLGVINANRKIVPFIKKANASGSKYHFHGIIKKLSFHKPN